MKTLVQSNSLSALAASIEATGGPSVPPEVLPAMETPSVPKVERWKPGETVRHSDRQYEVGQRGEFRRMK